MNITLFCRQQKGKWMKLLCRYQKKENLLQRVLETLKKQGRKKRGNEKGEESYSICSVKIQKECVNEAVKWNLTTYGLKNVDLFQKC